MTKYYSINEFSKILGVSAQTLRNWDKEGKLKPAYTKSNGYRYYSEESIMSYTQERKTKKELNKNYHNYQLHYFVFMEITKCVPKLFLHI